MNNKNYIIGTRGSLLAVTQCTLIKNEIEQKTNSKFILNKIVTQGDQITDKPLWQLEGKDFFTKELDAALLEKSIDMVVHSYKDLGSERPVNIKLGCITQRKYAQDILLIKKSKIAELSNLTEMNIGTSSPRRIYNLEQNLAEYLPVKDMKIKCNVLRGNVNTRIDKLLNDDHDAIVLALAGLERLASYPESKKILEELLKDLTFMILPQKAFPSSASQGALAIEFNETRSDDLAEIIKSVHDIQTEQEISRERTAFAKYGGGCHLAIGIHVKKVDEYFVHIHHGTHNGEKIELLKLEGFDYSSVEGSSVYYMHGKKDFLIRKQKIINPTTGQKNIFTTSAHCSPNIKEHNSLWAAGNKTMRETFAKGLWVNGSAEGFGHTEIEDFKKSNAIQILLGNHEWSVLSHDKASSPVGEIIPSYTHVIEDKINEELKEDLFKSDIIYWASFIQYGIYTEKYPELKLKKHACGLGKTLISFKEHGIKVIPCIDIKHLKTIL